jgi:hypothetical protein
MEQWHSQSTTNASKAPIPFENNQKNLNQIIQDWPRSGWNTFWRRLRVSAAFEEK